MKKLTALLLAVLLLFSCTVSLADDVFKANTMHLHNVPLSVTGQYKTFEFGYNVKLQRSGDPATQGYLHISGLVNDQYSVTTIRTWLVNEFGATDWQQLNSTRTQYTSCKSFSGEGVIDTYVYFDVSIMGSSYLVQIMIMYS